MVFLKVFLLALALLSIGMIGFMIKVIVKPKGEFSENRVGHNDEMRKRKVYCIKAQQMQIDKGLDVKERHNTSSCAGCV